MPCVFITCKNLARTKKNSMRDPELISASKYKSHRMVYVSNEENILCSNMQLYYSE